MKMLDRLFQTNALTAISLVFLVGALYDSYYLQRLRLPGGMLTTVVFQNRGQYNCWVWAVKPEKKASNRVRVDVAHAAAGARGAFQIIAFADTTGDGIPDTEIARSELFSADRPGRWSTFEFITAEKAIFVGNAWPTAGDVDIYRKTGEWPVKDSPFESKFYFALPPQFPRKAGPAFTNMKISFAD